MAEQSNSQVRYDKIEDLGLSIDELVSKTSLSARVQAPSSVKRMDELYVPLPSIVNLSTIKHTPGQSEVETKKESEKVDEVIKIVNDKLEKNRQQLGYQLEILGFSNWSEDLKELQKKNPNRTVHVEDLVQEVYSKLSAAELHDPKALEKKLNSKLGGSLSNLQSSVDSHSDDKSYANKVALTVGVIGGALLFPVFGPFSIAAGMAIAAGSKYLLSSHNSTSRDQIAAEKNIIDSQFATIKKLSQSLVSARSDVKEVNERDAQRDQVIAQALKASSEGRMEDAQALSIKADSLVEGIKARLLKADEVLSAKNSFEFKEHLKELSKVQEKWTAVDKSYEKTISFMDGASHGLMMLVAVGAGAIFAAPAALGAIGAFAVSALITTGVGFSLAVLRNLAQGASSVANGTEFSLEAAVADVKSTTFETFLMGLGGGLMAGLKVGLGLGAAGTKLITNASVATKLCNFIKSACGSGITGVGTSLPSNCYHYLDDRSRIKSELKEQIFRNNQLSDEEYAFLERNERLAFSDRKEGMIKRDPKTGEPYYEMSLQDKKNLYLHTLAERMDGLNFVYSLDMTVNFLCGFAGHGMSIARNSHVKGLMPKPTVPVGGTAPVVDALTTGRAVVMRPVTAGFQVSSHALELALAKYTTDLNLSAREMYLHEKATDEQRARAYGQALSSQFLGNIQGDMSVRQQRMSADFNQDAQKLATESYQAEINRTGVKQKDLERLHLVEKAEGKTVGLNSEIPVGTRWGDLQSASRALWMWTMDRAARVCDKVTGSAFQESFKRDLSQVDQAVKHINEQTKYSKEFKDDFASQTKTLSQRAMYRQAQVSLDGDINDPKFVKAQYNELQKLLECQLGEADYNTNRALRGEGLDENGIMTKALKEHKQNLQKFVTGPLKYISENVETFYSQAKRSFYSIGKSITDIPVAGPAIGAISKIGFDLANIPVHLAKRVFVDAPLLKGFIFYSAFNSASALHGPGGVLAIASVLHGATKHLAFQVGRKLGFNAPRAKDAACALVSNVEINNTLKRMKGLAEINPEIKIPKNLELEVESKLKKLNTTFAEFTQPRRTNPFLALGLFSLYNTPLFMPAMLSYGAYMALAPVIKPLAYKCLRSPMYLVPDNTRAWLADKCINGSKRLMSPGTGMSLLRGEHSIYQHMSALSPVAMMGMAWADFGLTTCLLPLALPVVRQLAGESIKITSHQLLNAGDFFMPDNLIPRRSKNYTPAMLADLQYNLQKSLSNSAGMDHIKSFKVLEDGFIRALESKKTDIKEFARIFAPIFSELDAPLRDQLLYRASVVAEVDAELSAISNKPDKNSRQAEYRVWRKKQAELREAEKKLTPDEKKALVEQRKLAEDAKNEKLKSAFGADTHYLNAGNRKASEYNIDVGKIELLKKIIENRNDQAKVDALLAPHLVAGKQVLSSFDVMQSRAKADFNSEIFEAIKTGEFDASKITALLKMRESYDSFAEIGKAMKPVFKKTSSGTEIVKGKEGLLYKIALEENKSKKLAKEAKLEARKMKNVAEKTEKLNEAQEHKAKAKSLKDLYHVLEGYVLSRENMLRTLQGDKPVDTLNLRALADYNAAPSRVKAVLKNKLLHTQTSNVDGKKETVFVLNENRAMMTREQQLAALRTLEGQLNRAGYNASEKLEVLSWIKGELEKSKNGIIDKRVKNFKEKPEETAPTGSFNPFRSFLSCNYFNPLTWGKIYSNYKQRLLVERARNGLEGKETEIKVDDRAKKLIQDRTTKIEGLKLFDVYERYNPFKQLGLFWKKQVSNPGTLKAAERCFKRGITCTADIDSIVKKLLTDPNAAPSNLTWRMKEQARIISDNTRSSLERYEAQIKLKELLIVDLDKVKDLYKGIESQRAAADKRIKEVQKIAFEIGSPLEINLRRYNEILGTARNHVIGDGNSATGGLSWKEGKPTKVRSFLPNFISRFLLTAAPVELVDDGAYKRMPSIWDMQTESADYRGYSYQDRASYNMPKKYPSLDMTLKPAQAKAYGDSSWQQGLLSWITGPVDMRYAGYYGDSVLCRLLHPRLAPGWNWFWRRLGVRPD